MKLGSKAQSSCSRRRFAGWAMPPGSTCISGREGLGRTALTAARKQLVEDANGSGRSPRPSPGLEDTPSSSLVNDEAITAFQIAPANVNSTLSTAWGGTTSTTSSTGAASSGLCPGRCAVPLAPQDLGQWYVRGNNGQMAPFSAFAKTEWIVAPPVLPRFNGIAAQEIVGNPTPGSARARPWPRWKSSPGLNGGYTVAWTGLSYQERGEQPDRRALWHLGLLHLPVPCRAL
jgi:multidrug efflux pump